MSDDPSKKSAHKIEFKLMLEGRRVPFFSANTQETADGVFANISLIPTENVMDLEVGTSVQLFFKEITSRPDSLNNNKNQWRLMFDGEFRGFNTFETAKAGAGITILCKCFRNYFRRVAMGFLFSGEFGAVATTKTSRAYGVMDVIQVNPTDMTLGNFRTKIQEFVSSGAKYAADIGDDKNTKMERAFMSVVTSFWNNTKNANPVARNIGYRTKLVRKIIGFKNTSGFLAFSNSQMPFNPNGIYDGFAQLFVSNSGMSMVEAGIQQIANNYKMNFFHCGTPTFLSDLFGVVDNGEKKSIVSHNDLVTTYTVAMPDPNYKTTTDKDGNIDDVASDTMPGGNPNRLNQMMILPLLPYTAPPKCNIMFPALYTSISYMLDYDSDTTRALGLIPYFLKSAINDPSNAWESETFFFPKVGNGNPNTTPVTLDEYRKGIIPFTMTMNQTDARTNAQKQIKRYKQEQAAGTSDVDKKVDDPVAANALKADIQKGIEKAIAQTNDESKAQADANKSSADSAPETSMEYKFRLVQYEYLFKNHLKRQVNVSGPFNPYSICGFPMVLIKEDSRDIASVQIPQSMSGLLLSKSHSIDAQSMTASTTHVLSHFRPVNQPTSVDLYGQPVYSREHGALSMESFVENFWSVRGVDGLSRPNKQNFRTIYEALPGTKAGGVKYNRYSDVIDASQSNAPGMSYVDIEGYYLNVFKSKWKYARDFTSYVEKPIKGEPGVKSASSRGAWLDYFYSPQVIGTVYAGILYNKKSSDVIDGSFMYGDIQSDQDKCTSYATVHEAVEKKLETPDMIGKSFDEAIDYVWRPICTESQFYLGIMDCVSVEMYNTLRQINIDGHPNGGANIPFDDDPYPNFDSDKYIPAVKYFEYKTWANFWNNYNNGIAPEGYSKVGYSMQFDGDRMLDFSRQGGKCFDIESILKVEAYIESLNNLPFGSDQM